MVLERVPTGGLGIASVDFDGEARLRGELNPVVVESQGSTSGHPVDPVRAEERQWSPWRAILFATLLGAIVRAAPLLLAGFPINDGGMFASLIDAILTGPGLPNSITYNDLNAPFAYPPLAFVVTAGLERLLPIGTVEWLRWIPLITSVALIPACALLALELAPTKVHAVIATFVFALVPRSFEWLVMGGGLTRSLGFLFAILAILMLIRYLRHGGRAWIGAGISLGLAVLSHAEGGLFAALSLTIASLAYARDRHAWSRTIAAAALGVLVALPWLVSTIGSHGLTLLISAGGTGLNVVQGLYFLLTMTLTDEPLVTLTASLAALGFIYSLSRRWYFLSLWVILTVLIDPRAAATYVSVPLSILAAIGLLDVVIARVIHIAGDISTAPGWPRELLRARPVAIILGAALEIAFLSALISPFLLGSMASLGGDARSAMAWTSDSLPASARVVVVTGRIWTVDAPSEWFPYLAGRRSVATVQGNEWLGPAAWDQSLDRNFSLQARAGDTVASLDDWADEFGVEFDYVFLPKGQLGGPFSPGDCCAAMRTTLRESPNYQVVYDGPGATIGHRVSS